MSVFPAVLFDPKAIEVVREVNVPLPPSPVVEAY
jgi:hypothetical protein